MGLLAGSEITPLFFEIFLWISQNRTRTSRREQPSSQERFETRKRDAPGGIPFSLLQSAVRRSTSLRAGVDGCYPAQDHPCRPERRVYLRRHLRHPGSSSYWHGSARCTPHRAVGWRDAL